MSTPFSYSNDYQLLPTMHCPWCGHILNAVGQADHAQCERPAPGDFTICIACAQVAVFATATTLRRAQPEEIDATVQQVQQDIRRMHARLN